MQFLTYEQWIAENPEAALENEDCEGCEGEGVKVCACCENETECRECDGQGKVNTARQQYEQHLRDEKVKLEKWTKVFGAVPA